MRLAVFPFLILALPAQAVEYAHCYTGGAPEDAPLTTVSPPPMDGFYSAFDVATVRFACGLKNDTDSRVLDAQREAGGCSAESEIAAFTAETWEHDISEYRAALEGLLGGAEAVTAFCATLEPCDGTDGDDYPAACYEAYNSLMGQE